MPHSYSFIRHAVLACAAVLVLAACSTPRTYNFQTAAKGTREEARQVVSRVYGTATVPLLYNSHELASVLERIRMRRPEWQALLAAGRAANGESGFLVLRDDAAADPAIRAMVLAENEDRRHLYDEVSAEVGHGGDSRPFWRPYVAQMFGREWIAQGEPGWWQADEAGVWHAGQAAAPR